MNSKAPTITVSVKVNRSVKDIWEFWTDPMHVIKWNAASEDWFTPYAENDVRKGGSFLCRMEAKDGSTGFDFTGTYTQVSPESTLQYTMTDGRKVKVSFSRDGEGTLITEEFDPETTNSLEMQRSGWQSILHNFKKYAEKKTTTELLKFQTRIQAPVSTVYNVLLGEESYKQWTKVFNPDSQYVGSWKKGSTIRFVGVDEKGNKGGMLSRIRENIPNKFVSIEHLGIIQGDQEITNGPEVESWAGSLENYKLTSDGKSTILDIAMDSNEEFKNYFSETWPKALKLIKEMCEK